MTKEQVIEFRDTVANDKILKIFCDNQHIFYDHVESKCPLIWDDEDEILIVIRLCQDSTLQQSMYPVEIVQTSYDMIQFMMTYETVADALEFKDRIPADRVDHFEKFLNDINKQTMSAPRRFSNTKFGIEKPEEIDIRD
ncbi:MAG: hypothetical protein PHC62_01070 [Candidatus Izemoplasmatales bacterium]|nr:hypothetical protein [Candidatus Izemoplasmatales bacterium]